MIRDYMIVSPSLDGILSHDSLTYEGLKRPLEVLRALDGPASKGRLKDSKQNVSEGVAADSPITEAEHKVLEQYFHDLYGVFMKKLSQFAIVPEAQAADVLQLQAMLQEMIKVKKLL